LRCLDGVGTEGTFVRMPPALRRHFIAAVGSQTRYQGATREPSQRPWRIPGPLCDAWHSRTFAGAQKTHAGTCGYQTAKSYAGAAW